MQWLDPWCDIANFGSECDTTFERELAREVAADHPLYGIPVAAVGMRNDTDDVLFRLLDGSGRVAVVHLTWAQSLPERSPWPIADQYASSEAFAEERMQPDHEEFTT